ncbi:Phospholipid transfer protein, partial [Eschrichtius robustus]|nr:Phospholipid transfer protein [Eschrichtius robustus]
MALFGALFLALLAGAQAELPGCKIRITSTALELVKQEGLRFLEQELETITIPDLRGREGHFYYNISEVKVMELQLTSSELHFQPEQELMLQINNGSLGLRFRRQLLYWFLDVETCSGRRWHLSKATQLGAFFPLADGNWSLRNQAVEPQLPEEERMVYVAFSEFFFDSAMESYFRAGALKLSLVGAKVPHDLDMLLRATYFGNIVLLVSVSGREEDLTRLELDLSSLLCPQSPAEIDSPLKLELRVTAPPRCTIKPSGTTISVTASVTIALVPPDQPEVKLSSMTMDVRLSAKMALRGKVLRTQLDLRRFRIYSNQSALESLALIPLQAPLKTMLQIGVMPMLNERTWRGVQIPLPEGIDFVREVVTNHVGFLTIGADLHFAKGLREVIEKNRPANTRDPRAPSAPPPSMAAV